MEKLNHTNGNVRSQDIKLLKATVADLLDDINRLTKTVRILNAIEGDAGNSSGSLKEAVGFGGSVSSIVGSMPGLAKKWAGPLGMFALFNDLIRLR